MDMKQARQQLGLSLSEFAALHGVKENGARRWEMLEDSSGYRTPSGSAIAFTQALLDGYRPCSKYGPIPTPSKELMQAQDLAREIALHTYGRRGAKLVQTTQWQELQMVERLARQIGDLLDKHIQENFPEYVKGRP